MTDSRDCNFCWTEQVVDGAAKSFELHDALAYNCAVAFDAWQHCPATAYCCHMTDQMVARLGLE
jgi:hypothetical protein